MKDATWSDRLRDAVTEIAVAGADDDTVNRAKTLVGRTPVLDTPQRSHLMEALNSAPRTTSTAGRELIDDLSGTDMTPTLDRQPVVFPPLATSLAATWHTLIDLDSVPVPWVLVGGNMVALHCLENGHPRVRATDDGDVVVDVWTHRGALRQMTRRLVDRGYREVETGGLGFTESVGFKYVSDTSRIDMLLPENIDRQRVQPTTSTGSAGMSALGANRSLIRAERLPVDVAGIRGYVRRPSLVGALTIKVRAAMADRQPRRHLEDITDLIAIISPRRRELRAQVAEKDKHWFRRILRSGALLADLDQTVLSYLVDDPKHPTSFP